MKHLPLAALGAALIMTGCVAYPVDTYHDRGDRGAYRDNNWRYDGDQRRDERRDRDRDRRGRDNRDGDRHD
ncbi:MAG TPA: hypothetical protein VGO85_10565 [Caldimonas sp.]|jgi:hypothetical protein|nr:hypothetical protein [Caldimonas sp.]